MYVASSSLSELSTRGGIAAKLSKSTVSSAATTSEFRSILLLVRPSGDEAADEIEVLLLMGLLRLLELARMLLTRVRRPIRDQE